MAGVSNVAATNGGSGGGGAGANCHSIPAPGLGTVGEGRDGGIGGGTCAQHSGAGGGGALNPGGNDTVIGGNALGGAGKANDISGGSVTYAAGGRSGTGGAGTAGGANTGNGGNGNSGAGAVGGAGGSGVVIIRYVTADFGTCTGGTITTSGADTIHTFTSSGTFTVVEKASMQGEGYRFRNDDGSETTATFKAAQDTNISQGIGSNVRVRVIANATGDPPSTGYVLQYRRKTSGEAWKDV